MFIITDCTHTPPFKIETNYTKDVRDIVLKITGDEVLADATYRHVSKMTSGDVLIVNPLFIIDCSEESFPFDSESVISIFKDIGIF